MAVEMFLVVWFIVVDDKVHGWYLVIADAKGKLYYVFISPTIVIYTKNIM